MDASPFPYQGPLSPEQVRGRDDLVLDLLERVSERRVTALLGPRRYGKTSVLARVAAELVGGGASVVWVDLYEVTSMADVASTTRLGDWYGNILRIGRRQQLLFISERSRLPVVIPIREASTSRWYFQQRCVTS